MDSLKNVINLYIGIRGRQTPIVHISTTFAVSDSCKRESRFREIIHYDRKLRTRNKLHMYG